MKKITFIIASFVFCSSFVFASENSLNSTLEKIKQKREYIYNNLNLSDSQKTKQIELDNKYFNAIKPSFEAMEKNVKDISDLANSKNVSKEEVDLIRKEFDKNEKELSDIKGSYEKEFRRILTFKQKIKYEGLKRKTRAELRKEVSEEIRKIKEDR